MKGILASRPRRFFSLLSPAKAILSPDEVKVLSGRIGFVDGLRALAALYVVFHHAMQFAWPNGGPPNQPWIFIVNFLLFGRLAVTIFIALSGFVLIIPILRNRGVFKRGILNFYRRRAFRILPAYYLAMAISLILIFGPLHELQGTAWDVSAHVRLRSIFFHLFLVHNWTSSSLSIDSPMWSLAIEWQIYLVFPIIVYAWYRLGALPVLVGFLVLALIDWTPFQMFTFYLAFSIGMLTAQLGPWILNLKSNGVHSVLGAINSFLNNPTLLKVGGFSYSLYLTHIWTMAAIYRVMMIWEVQPHGPVAFAWLVGAGVPIAILVAYLFSLIGERPFLSKMATAALAKNEA